MDKSPTIDAHGWGPVSDWVKRWSHLVPPGGSVLDIACGRGRHVKWFASRGHAVTGVDRSAEAIQAVAGVGEAVFADIENNPWPLMNGERIRQFSAVVVTNYLWRPLFPVIVQSVAPGGFLIYETFSQGNETVGKPSNPEFLLRPAELLQTLATMRIIGFEEGFLEDPPRFVQRIVTARPDLDGSADEPPARYPL